MGFKALSVLTISDHLLTHEALPAADRERSFGDMGAYRADGGLCLTQPLACAA